MERAIDTGAIFSGAHEDSVVTNESFTQSVYPIHCYVRKVSADAFMFLLTYPLFDRT